MSGVNKVIIIGNLGKNPELKQLASGGNVANLTVATSESWKDKQTGEKKEQTEWHRINFFGPVADICGKWLKKGSKVYIEGSIHTRKWQDNNGQDKYSTEIKGREMKMLGSAKGSQQQQEQQQGYSAENFDSDIPF